MKKKLLSLVLLLSVCLVTSVVTFVTGCGGVKDVDKMTFTTSPDTTFTQTAAGVDQVFTFGLKVKVKGNETTYDVTYKNGTIYVNDAVETTISVANFDLTTVGEKTATVKYKSGDTELSLAFTYTVVADTNEFAGGTGTEKDPYKIATAAQFQNMLKKVNKFAYYVFVNDIDFADVTIKTPTAYELVAPGQAFTGVVDGNGYIMKNVRNANYTVDANKYMTIFGVVGNFTLKDITVDFAVDATCTSPVSAIVMSGIKDSKLKFENVDVTGYTDGKVIANSGFAPYVTFMGRKQADKVNADPASVEFKDCANSISMYNTNGRNAVAGFAITSATDVAISFTGCSFSGYIEGASKALGAFYSNNGATDVKNATLTNCSVTGSFVQDGAYEVAPVGVHAGKTATANSALAINSSKIKVVEKSINITYDESNNVWKLTKPANVASYAVVVCGSMYYDVEKTSSGACTYQHNIKVDADGVFDIFKVKFNDGNFVAAENDEYKLSALTKFEDGVINYYGKSVCKGIGFAEATIKVLGYDAEGNLVAYGTYTDNAGNAIKVNLNAIA